MNDTWDLSILYKDFDDPAFTGDMAALDQAIAAVNALAGEAAGMDHSQLVHRFLQVQEQVEELTNKLFIFCSLRCSANTADTKANSLGDQLSAKLSGCAAANASLRRTVAGLEDLDAIMDADPALEPYRFLLESIRRDSKYLLTDREEELFARMNISGASAWETLRDNLTSSVKVEYNGGVTNLSAIRNLAYDPDPAVRKSAYEAELACYDKIKDSVAFALNSIKMQVINECQVRGYASPLDKALYQSRMKRETLDALLGAMDEYMPKFWQYLRAKGKALGHENGLPWYELFAPMGKSDKKYTTQDAKDYLLNIFGGFAPASQTAEELSKALGSRTVMSGSISRGKNDPSQSLQMMERPLMTPDELKSMPKGSFIVAKTGVHPMRVRLRLFLDWGIRFGEPYEVPEKAQRPVAYADKQELEEAIIRRHYASSIEDEENQVDQGAAAAGGLSQGVRPEANRRKPALRP